MVRASILPACAGAQRGAHSEPTMNQPPYLLDRREFIATVAALGLLARGGVGWALPAADVAASAPAWLAQQPWSTLNAVMAHLLPAGEGIPGAEQIHAIIYLHNTLTTPGADDGQRERMLAGAERVSALAQADYGKLLQLLDGEQREAVLRKLEGQSGGQRWLSWLLNFVLEALLADPVYGGNPDGIGWTWLQHQPGYPRPPADKVWYQLTPPIQRRSKAT
ncbi:MAG: hypothetical protein CVV15_08145 [Gammaproteobacteria bacterium HGW-Gammaproteobacteria-5]|nr:MAG: hypothetical protein CVV15_08145 [Gammaproteobacteria bacterium HGW-Gammaproteobacteria-5]